MVFCEDEWCIFGSLSSEMAFCEDEWCISGSLSLEVAFGEDGRKKGWKEKGWEEGRTDGRNRWKGLVGGGDAPEKCATLGIIRGRGPQAGRSVATEGFKGNLPLVPWGCRGIVVFLSKTGRGRIATFSGASPSADPQIQHSPSLGVPADGPQTTEMGENVVWGAARWTSNDENGRKRRLRCPRMDLKRRKQAKTSLGVPADGPQTTETGENVAWGAGKWTSSDENERKRRLGCK